MNKYQKCLLKQKLIGLAAVIGSILFVCFLGEWLGGESLIVPILCVPMGLYLLFSKEIELEFDELYEEDEDDWA